MLEIVIASIPVMLFLGFRHALDLDHITAIDNIVRLYSSNNKARLVGLFFSSGHMLSVIVELFIIILIIENVSENILSLGSILGISALLFISILNIYSLRRYGKNYASILSNKIINKFNSPFITSFITGIIFGLAFDTATQISAIVLASMSSLVLGFNVALLLAGLFAIGMILMDTLDSILLRSLLTRLANKVYIRASYTLSSIGSIVSLILLYEFITNTELLPEWSGMALFASSLLVLFILSLSST